MVARQDQQDFVGRGGIRHFTSSTACYVTVDMRYRKGYWVSTDETAWFYID
jgi:hypothetical protein